MMSKYESNKINSKSNGYFEGQVEDSVEYLSLEYENNKNGNNIMTDNKNLNPSTKNMSSKQSFNFNNMGTNHSFNGFFNTDNSQNNNAMLAQQNNSPFLNNNYLTNSKSNKNTPISMLDKLGLNTKNKTIYNSSTRQTSINPKNLHFQSSGKLSDYKFTSISDSSKHTQAQDTHNSDIQKPYIHEETRIFVEKYFPDIFYHSQSQANYQQKYIALNDFIELIFEEYQNVMIGKENNFNAINMQIIENFTDKVFDFFGDKIYFIDLFNKTQENGMTGLIFQVFKAIKNEEEENQIQAGNYFPLSQIRNNHKMPTKGIKGEPQNNQNHNLLNSNNRGLLSLYPKTASQSRITTIDESMNSQLNRQSSNAITKISLDKVFSNQNSKMKILDYSSYMSEDLDEVKQVLAEYIQEMYEEAEKKLNKKYTHQYKKIAIKYKQTQKVLQKINEKISSHYDSLTAIKQFEKKIKIMKQKQAELETKIRTLELDRKTLLQDTEKYIANNMKLQQQIQRLNTKMEKYQNAIFEKAMEKSQSTLTNPLGGSQITNNGSNIGSRNIYEAHQFTQGNTQTLVQGIQNRPSNLGTGSFTGSNINIRSHSPYNPVRQVIYQPNGPTQNLTNERFSVSPIKSRVSFNKVSSTNLNTTPTSTVNNATETTNLQISTVQKVEIGEPIVLRPLSPIGKLQHQNQFPNNITIIANEAESQRIAKNYQPAQFSSSRVITVSPLRRCI